METFKIYLAGSMGDISFEESNKWRVQGKKILESLECEYRVNVINPNDYYNFKEKAYETEKEIIRFDLHKVRTSNLILVNLNGKSLGTAMELQHAFDHGIPIVGFKDDGTALHPWLEFTCDRVFDNLLGSLEFIENYHLK